jgi:mono/diheme cytochrome c family protein
MRHLLANIITYTIAVLLFIGAAAFAWMRSSQLMLTTEERVFALHEPVDEPGFRWQALGEHSYERNCSNCHRPDGSGWDQYPPVTTAAALLAQPAGRAFLIDLHLYGLTSSRWGAPMPRMSHLQDVEIAAVLNFIATEYGGADSTLLVLPDEVAARRGQRLRPADVERRRPPEPLPPRR